jgi:hypothetical protein
MAGERKAPQEGRLISETPRVEVVGGETIRLEFRIEDLVSQLMRQRSPSGIIVASCGGCNGCSATA